MSTRSVPDRFFMMGDNSPRSKDSRGWGTDDAAWDDSDRKPWEVPRQLLTGKAFYVYWPHGSRSGPTSGSPTISAFRSGLTSNG